LELLEDRCLLSAGALDATFNPTGNPPGTVTTSLTSARDIAYVPLAQPDGKIVAAGDVLAGTRGNWEFGVARYSADGSLDSSFGSGGTALAAFAHSAYGWAAALYPKVGTANDGKIVVEGWTYVSSKKGFTGDVLALARFNTNGTLDSTFGSGGEVTTAFPSVGSVTSRGVVITSTGKIVAVGDNGTDYVLARYNANGTLDPTFGTGGTVTTAFTSGTYEENLAQQPDGKLVVVGETGSSWQLVRYNVNGTLDSSFGNGGVVVTAGSTVANTKAVAIYPNAGTANDGKIIVAGTVKPGNYQEFAVNRYNPDGSLDTTWGGSGEVTTAISANNDQAGGVAIQSDGKVVAAGRSAYNGNFRFALTRYNTEGSLDSTFGAGGIVITAIGTATSEANGVVIQSNGDIVVAGNTLNGSAGNFAMARYLPSEPEVGSFTASPNPVTAGSSLTLTASGITDANPASTIAQVVFYYDDSTGSKQILGYGTQTSPGVWTLNYTVNLPSGSYTVYAQAEDSYGVFGDPIASPLTVQ
jgi:uncharacterized delta-60 repeat protein